MKDFQHTRNENHPLESAKFIPNRLSNGQPLFFGHSLSQAPTLLVNPIFQTTAA